MDLRPISRDKAFAFISKIHRHHVAPQGWKFGISLWDGERMVGVVVVGRPVSYRFDDGFTAEVTRLCTDGTPNACSILYRAAWRAAKEMGYRRMVTYILQEEPGTSLRAAGWVKVGDTKGGSWNSKGRPRTDKHPTTPKQLWEVRAEGKVLRLQSAKEAA